MNIWHQFVGYFSDGLQALANFYGFLGSHKWAAAIITLTLIVRTLLLPLAVKQIRGMRDQQRLQPELQRLRQKYKTDRQKLTQETMELFRREGVNPYAACLPMVAQMPVFIGIYQALRKLTTVPKELAKRIDPTGHNAAKVLDYAQQHHIIPKMPFLGLGDLAHPANSSIAGWLLIVAMTAAQLLTTRQLNPGTTDQQRRLQMLMPFMFVFLFIRFPAGLVLYWATQSTYQLVQQLVMTRDMRKESGGWRSLLPWTPGGKKSQPKRKEPKRAPVTVPATAVASSAGTFDDAERRRVLAEKRRRRRRKKKKR